VILYSRIFQEKKYSSWLLWFKGKRAHMKNYLNKEVL